MNTKAVRANRQKLAFLAALVLLCAAGYMLVGVHLDNAKLVQYAMKIRTPKLIVMLVTAFAIGGASIVFQSVINNTIVTPCLLGMNSLYTLIHTAVVFAAGSGSILAANANCSFAVDLVLMGVVATVVCSYLFKKAKHNVLYVLLIGTVLPSFFSSIQSTLTRVMDPNEYGNLLATLAASFSNINSEIIVISLFVLAGGHPLVEHIYSYTIPVSVFITVGGGTVDFKGSDIVKRKSRKLSKRLAILTQANNIQIKLTVRELVTFGRFPCSGGGPRRRTRRSLNGPSLTWNWGLLRISLLASFPAVGASGRISPW